MQDSKSPSLATYQVEGETLSSDQYARKYMREVLGETEEEIERLMGK